MDYIWAVALAVIVVAFAIVMVIRSKNPNCKDESFADVENLSSIIAGVQESGIIIPIEQLPSAITIDERKLFEITDNTVIARISDTIPRAMEIAAKTVTNNALKNVELYKAIIPSSATLTKSKQMEGAVRGYFHGAKGVRGQANLVKVDPTKISKASTMANGVANVMNVGSLVVGQYYMTEINAKIEDMSKNINKISDFQDREFKSRILAVIARVREISNFSSEILENDDVRNRKLQALDDLKGEGVQLLQQVNLDIDDTIKKKQKPDYKEYQESVDSFSVLIGYQQILMSVLEEISKLTYLLEKGERTSEFCYSLYNTYFEQSNKIRTALEAWHQQQADSLGIDIDKNRKSKTGVEGFFAAIPGIIDDKWNYKELASGLGQKINAQKTTNQLVLGEP